MATLMACRRTVWRVDYRPAEQSVILDSAVKMVDYIPDDLVQCRKGKEN